MKPLLAVIIIIIGLVGYKLYTDKQNQPATQSTNTTSAKAKAAAATPVDIYIAKRIKTDNTIFASGTVVSNEEVELRSEVSGRLVELNIREGSYVKKGAVIARLSNDDLQAQLKKNQFEEELANQIEARQKKLLEIDAISKEEYDLAVNKVNTLGADKEFIQVQLDRTQVMAPFSGKIGFKNISEGAYITPTTIIANLVQTNPVKIDFSVPEKYASKLVRGQALTFKIDGNDDIFEAKVTAINPKVDETLRTLKARAIASNRKGNLLPGMFVRVEVPLQEKEAIMIPSQAIVPILKGKKVYVLKKGKATEALIRTNLRTDKLVEVEEGLVVGDSIIISALMSMRQGAPVVVRDIIQ